MEGIRVVPLIARAAIGGVGSENEGSDVGIYRELVKEGESAGGDVVSVERGEDRATVTLNQPEQLNALSAPLVIGVKNALTELAADPGIRSIVLTGAGDGFSAGGDLKMMSLAEDRLSDDEGSTDIWRWIRYEFGGVVRLIARSDTAFIAALNGPAARPAAPFPGDGEAPPALGCGLVVGRFARH